MAVPIAILSAAPDLATRTGRHAFAGAMGLIALAIVNVLIALAIVNPQIGRPRTSLGGR